MMSSLANSVLFLALVTTSAIVAIMYRKLKRLDAYHAEYKKIFDETGAALASAQDAVIHFGAESRETLAALGARIEEAKVLIQRLEDLNSRSGAQASSSSNAANP
jgi:hypothetical protein